MAIDVTKTEVGFLEGFVRGKSKKLSLAAGWISVLLGFAALDSTSRESCFNHITATVLAYLLAQSIVEACAAFRSGVAPTDGNGAAPGKGGGAA